jgi:hypothetical protein
MSRSRIFGSRSRHRLASIRSAGGVSSGSAPHSGSRINTAAERRRDVLAVERAAAGQHFVEHDAERPDVGAAIDGLPLACSGAM